jgi:copper chaperone
MSPIVKKPSPIRNVVFEYFLKLSVIIATLYPEGRLMSKVIIHVEGMSCNHCKMAVEKSLSALAGVSQVEVDLKKKTASVSYDETVCDKSALNAAIEDAGFTAAG